MYKEDSEEAYSEANVCGKGRRMGMQFRKSM